MNWVTAFRRIVKQKEGSSHLTVISSLCIFPEKVKELPVYWTASHRRYKEESEMIGEFKNGGQEWEKKGKPVEVNVYDFPDPILGKGFLTAFTI